MQLTFSHLKKRPGFPQKMLRFPIPCHSCQYTVGGPVGFLGSRRWIALRMVSETCIHGPALNGIKNTNSRNKSHPFMHLKFWQKFGSFTSFSQNDLFFRRYVHVWGFPGIPLWGGPCIWRSLTAAGAWSRSALTSGVAGAGRVIW